MTPKDLFSNQAHLYAAYRPAYPQELYDLILSHVKDRGAAWDCATGNGQVATVMANYFKSVQATDISQSQLDHAAAKPNITYSRCPAEKTSFHRHQFDLVTVAQALHWFDREAFFQEVERVTKPTGILAVWGYAMLSVSPDIDKLITTFYNDVVGPYWDDARRLVEQEYQTIVFPFKVLDSTRLVYPMRWTIQHLEGYLSTWSATQQYIQHQHHNPVPEVIENIRKYWEGELPVSFPIFVKVLAV